MDPAADSRNVIRMPLKSGMFRAQWTTRTRSRIRAVGAAGAGLFEEEVVVNVGPWAEVIVKVYQKNAREARDRFPDHRPCRRARVAVQDVAAVAVDDGSDALDAVALVFAPFPGLAALDAFDGHYRVRVAIVLASGVLVGTVLGALLIAIAVVLEVPMVVAVAVLVVVSVEVVFLAVLVVGVVLVFVVLAVGFAVVLVVVAIAVEVLVVVLAVGMSVVFVLLLLMVVVVVVVLALVV